ncbi:cysteine desulfurase family protein [Alkalibacillus haloalkaliphilus]|uniref:cysteine desulfurase family protein n=1 Tax=Alkalibacillus haloalkaliphilus TaxID=94136 RepID=UPI002936C774|nr:cysteine desulfurase family protein [Alkalibacillus haloalkaliphilus]MDV2581084.1 cysteine desulfurase family protein [Alkalibacillus haloalkaliphilus]
MSHIYLDHAATTPLHESVQEQMTSVMQNHFGNPSSIHFFGRDSRKLLDQARTTIAKSINAPFTSLIFTSGGTEANNLAIFGSAYANEQYGRHIITTQIEHHAVLHPCEQLESEGFDVTYLPVDETGQVDLNQLKEALRDDTILVTIMSVNNEVGVIQPIQEIGELLEEHQAVFHTDAVQAYGVQQIDVQEMKVDLLTASSHKIYGPKGVGFLYKHEKHHLKQQVFGGEQERKWRSGTENTLAIAGFEQAVKVLMEERESRNTHYQALFNELIAQLVKQEMEFSINGDLNNRVSNIVNISFPKTEVEMFLTNLDLAGIAVSSGSACTAGSIDPSHVLKAMYGEEDERLYNSIRFSFGIHNTLDEMKQVAEKIQPIVERLKNLS